MTNEPEAPVWHLVETQTDFEEAVERLNAGVGPVGVDAERASGFRYGNRAYLVQFYREGAGAFLFDPQALPLLDSLQRSLGGEEWIFHAASQDLPCLVDEGLVPSHIFDTELAARLLGMPRVGLATVVEELLGVSLAKAHSAADWSTRPLPNSWLDYAALDVTLLPSLREALNARLEAAHKADIAQQEFEAVLQWKPKPEHPEPWRRLSGLHKVTQPRALAIARELWLARDALARERDTAPGRLLPDSSLIAVALEPPRSLSHLASMKTFHGRTSRSELPRWWDAIYRGKVTADLPAKRLQGTREIPPHRLWAQRFPEADARLKAARAELNILSEEVHIPLENLLTPETLRRVAWEPPGDFSSASIAGALATLGARPWQRNLASERIAQAFREAEQPSSRPDL